MRDIPGDRRVRPRHLLAASAVALASTIVFSASRVQPAAWAGQLLPGDVKSLAPGNLLVASRDLRDPNFVETVVLLAQVTREGAMGVIINRESAVPVARALPDLQTPPDAVLFMGGPVEADGIVALARSTRDVTDSQRIFDDVYLVTAMDPLRAQFASGARRDRLRVYLGYAGWGAGQLERETLHGGWHVARGEAAIVFDDDPDSLWEREIKKTEGLLARHGPGQIGLASRAAAR
jgi:putative transcriptional regulator